MQYISLYNSRTRKIDELVLVSNTQEVTIYNCGPTVYKRQHIGNMRRFLNADFLKRTLELLGYSVKDITNITDVGHLTQDEIDAGEDKLEKEARETKRTPQDIAQEQTDLFFQDSDALNIQRSSLYPRATEHVQDMITLIERLIARGHAYTTTSGVYFDVTSFPAYGALSGNTVDALDAGHRVAVQTDKKHPADFALWMLDTNHLQLWDSPWGEGYPGWHIECSAMSMKYLGETIDIHTGGEDNRFPHHENEIAQSEGATGKQFVNVWMHNRHLLLSGKKMAKREGESITMDTLKEKEYSPLAFRILVFAHHYRSPIDFSWELLDEYQKHIESVQRLLERLPTSVSSTIAPPPFTSALADDVNTPLAFAVFLQTMKDTNSLLDAGNQTAAYEKAGELFAMDTVLGIMEPLRNTDQEEVPEEITQLVGQRETAKRAKDFGRADEIRQIIQAQGYTLEDTAFGPRIRKH
jgi:cysteinyl-tRNA synthetase